MSTLKQGDPAYRVDFVPHRESRAMQTHSSSFHLSESIVNSRIIRSALLVGLAAPLAAWSLAIVIDVAPPVLPLYAQPPVPGDGYLWTPGYWGWQRMAHDYYWVPGTWVRPPNTGALWTPGYWAYENTGYFWHGGYWGRRVGYYGGLNYGYGYSGSGYEGGRWERGYFRYNAAVNSIPSTGGYRVYSKPPEERSESPRESFRGGTSSIHAEPTADERRYQATTHGGLTPEQQHHEAMASAAENQRASMNHGEPPVAAMPRAATLDQHSGEPARADAPERRRGNDESKRGTQGDRSDGNPKR